ncbi:alpha/beta hydrolase family protein [Sphingobacterium faecale]|uniref:S9 family peptidase n=1 Tax=Sphingobacterium faecale TaxID=2803775 RepID=A0ABS1R8K0_9SPHI|nr:prolyl oligopeptidase family serine peptidase [Sphingobacterium faecale]MBL1410988.1 S9 family peptidase [Sphingobacterium faecale]
MTTKSLRFIYSFILILLDFTCYSQTIKDSVHYSLLYNNLLSSSGKFSTIKNNFLFDSEKNSIFIFNNNGKLLLTKQTNNKYEVLKNDFLIGINPTKTEIEILDPNTNKSKKISNVKEVEVINNYNVIFYFDTKTESYKLIKVLSSGIKEIWNIPQTLINFTSISNDKKHLLIQYSNLTKGTELINLENFKKTTNTSITDFIKSVIWDKKLPVVFLSPNQKHTNNFPYLTFFNYDTNLVKKQDLDSTISYSYPEAINEYSFKIVQYYNLVKKPYDTEKLQLWTTKDTELATTIAYPRIKEIKTDGHIIFNYKDKKVYQPDALNQYISIPLNENILLVYDPNQYIDYINSDRARPRDISIYDIKEDKFTLITKAQQNPFNTTSLSSKTNYFVYIKKGLMYFYNIEQRALENTFNLKEDRTKSNVYISRLRYWSEDGKYFYFASDNNFMQYDIKSKTFKVLIDGGNTSYRYKILNTLASPSYNQTSQIPSNMILDNRKLLIERYNIKESTSSILLLEGNKRVFIINNTNDQIKNVKYGDNFKTITYSLENFNKPATLYVYHNGITKLLLENSMPKELYTWKKQKIVAYKDKYNNDLKGILFYPKDFDPNKKYPMLTHTYEIQNYLAKDFTYPTYFDHIGFNMELYLEKGYFVFFPDVFTTKQGPGISALNCVEESIKKVLQEEKAINKDKLGLMGHSFGGYTTNFIVSQTNLFKAAVSGSGVADFISHYFSYNYNYRSPGYFQFETGQLNMLKPFKEDKELYFLNSPLFYAENINTPLLSFTGKEDKVISSKQQETLFMAMLRYKKPFISLMYEDEGHYLMKPENQLDLTKRLLNWFDYYLKNADNKETRWIKYNTTFDPERMLEN